MPKNDIQVQKERGNFVVACILPLCVVKLGISKDIPSYGSQSDRTKIAIH